MKAVALACVAAGLMASLPAGAAGQESKSAPLAKQLAAALDAAKLDSVAARDPSREDTFFAALYYPGVQLLAVSAKYSAPAGFTPPSPCTGSRRTAATFGSTADARASVSFQATWRKPSGSGWNGSCLVGCPVAWSVASVRPWNDP